MAEILIIGGGVSGLSAGIHACLSGHRAIICERNKTAGGNLTGWDRGEYHIDNCIHWLTGTNRKTETYKTWETLGALGSVEIYKPESLYTCTLGRESISLYRDIEKLRGRMLFISPSDNVEIESFISAVRCVRDIERIGDGNILSVIGSFPSLLKYYNLTAGELANKFSHPLLRLFFSSFLTEGFGALAIIVVFAHFTGGNADIPRGGSRAMAERMTRRFTSLGGELVLGKEVKRININKKHADSVTLDDGSEISADYIISSADPVYLFGTLTDLKMPSALKRRYESERMSRFSSFQVAFATKAKRLPFDGELIFELPLRYKERLSSKYIAVREFSHEESFSPSGMRIIQTMCFLDEQSSRAFIDLYTGEDAYRRKKEYLAGLISSVICEKIPELSGRLEYIDSWTPATYHRYTLSEIGSYMSFAFTSRVLPTSVSPRVGGANNLFLATQWQRAPGGLPIAAEAGKRAVKIIDAREKSKKTQARKEVTLAKASGASGG